MNVPGAFRGFQGVEGEFQGFSRSFRRVNGIPGACSREVQAVAGAFLRISGDFRGVTWCSWTIPGIFTGVSGVLVACCGVSGGFWFQLVFVVFWGVSGLLHGALGDLRRF